MGADFGTFFHHDNGHIRRELLEPDGSGKAGGPGADDDNIKLHRLAGGKVRAFMACPTVQTNGNISCFHPSHSLNGSSINPVLL